MLTHTRFIYGFRDKVFSHFNPLPKYFGTGKILARFPCVTLIPFRKTHYQYCSTNSTDRKYYYCLPLTIVL